MRSVERWHRVGQERGSMIPKDQMSQLMRLWYLSHRRPEKAQASLRIRAVSPEPSVFVHIKYGCRQSVRPNTRHLAPLDGCTCAFEKKEFTEDEKYHNLVMAQIHLIFTTINSITCVHLNLKTSFKKQRR